MVTIVLAVVLFAGAAAQDESACLGFIDRSLLPMDVYVAGTEFEGLSTLAEQAELIYLNGPGLGSLRAGGTYLVVRPEGYVNHPWTKAPVGIYYRELGTIRIERTGPAAAAALVMASCRPIMKGDRVIPMREQPSVPVKAESSDRLATAPEGALASAVVLGLDDRRELGAGDVCFIGVGTRDGVRPGDRFTVYRPQPPFSPQDLSVAGSEKARTYRKVLSGLHRREVSNMLRARSLPDRMMGDLVILRASETTAVAKVVNSRAEIHIGDKAVRR
ncbi:MAG: hypothetical protein HXY20_01910 [Acidobacteria bacterium]|nr:hypothetical protein [Acidobacteriota bacterium]